MRLVLSSLLCATALAGCSADLGRFDMASASFNSDAPKKRVGAPMPSEPLRRYAGAPMDEPPARPYAYNPRGSEPPGSSPAPVRQAGLPEPIMREPEARPAYDTSRPLPPQAERAPSARAPSDGAPSVGAPSVGATIDVQPGDTLYGIAKQHRVSISELMSANNLQGPMIRPGQKLVLPGSRRAVPVRTAARPISSPKSAPPSLPTRVAQPVDTDQAPSSWTGSHTVSPRDNLYGIARKYGVTVADLQAANGIPDPTKMRAGRVLKVPAANGSDTAETDQTIAAGADEASNTASAPPQPAEPARIPRRDVASAEAPARIGRPTIINAQERNERVATVTPANPVMTDAAPEAKLPAEPQPKATRTAAAPAAMTFRWPAKGRMIAKFGPRGDNTHNDGINILVPQGTPVAAAEAGVVAYAGSELKGYGNLVLVRHQGNWVSAYAHNESLLVKRGDRVERGQIIAKAGKTGAVDQPQVHFELRQGSKPVDPEPHLER